ncbi:uncharacterized protein LOC109833286 [Asparagus officinalis]|uniref:uncharacterized protein LOC109833286 n=1 Tax=Asparagus officinalis TaxID=4686 RepID=UPI00098DF589|nr:uncharacterized protein LOC109833286 [Asparagus officinalis]
MDNDGDYSDEQSVVNMVQVMADNTSLSGRDNPKGKGVVPSPSPPPQPPQSVHHGDGGYFPFQQSYFVPPPQAYPNMPFHDSSYFPMHHTLGSYTNMLNSSTLPPQFHSPNLSGVQLSHTSGNGSTPESGSKLDLVEEGVETSPNPKKKRKKTHLKKTMKQVVLKEPNICSGIPVMMMSSFHFLPTCGAGWDESTKTVIMEPEYLDRWIEDKSFKNAKLRQYVNKPLRHYDDLALIIGDDQATGQFASDAWKKFSRSETINLGDEMNSPMHSPQSTQVHILDDEDTPSPNEAHNTSSSKVKSSSAKVKARKTNLDSEIMLKMVDKIDVFSTNMKCVNMHWTEKLSTVLYAHSHEFSVAKLDTYYRHLFMNEHESRLFMGISSDGQKEMIEAFLNKED